MGVLLILPLRQQGGIFGFRCEIPFYDKIMRLISSKGKLGLRRWRGLKKAPKFIETRLCAITRCAADVETCRASFLFQWTDGREQKGTWDGFCPQALAVLSR